ncbi:acetyl-CoA acetyltransferase [Zavarzinia sp. CC-PAN008]|uniref:acetyl-CoA acetyltransferase n=1 Tax=Zavarzinia sp. CC-PAN008 TaxID=3243332 RepID=UPI003F74751B
MTVPSDRTPVIIGVGEASETIGSPAYKALSPADLAGLAARTAVADTGADAARVAAAIDTIATIPQFEASGPNVVAPFGKSNNFPRSVAKRIGANPARAIQEVVGGQGPQHLLSELAERIAAGEIDAALIAGSEAISTARDLATKGENPDWSEEVEGSLEFRGYGLDGLLSPPMLEHGIGAPVLYYAMFENARRGRLGLSPQAYAKEMGRLFAPFTRAASQNPHAMAPKVLSADELVTVTERNRLIAWPYPRYVVARDQANQGAAVIIASAAKARELGVPESKWVYLHGYADAKERSVLERADLSSSPASILAAKKALDDAGIAAADLGTIDLYSCFPIAVFNVADALGLDADDPRGLTVTGGLPFFGGAGNNYSMHAIAEVVERVRAKPGSYGLVAANGGFLSKYSTGVYSTTPRAFTARSSKALQAEVDGWQAPQIETKPEGDATIETYTVDYAKKVPVGIVIGRLKSNNARFVAISGEGDAEAVKALEGDALGRAIKVSPTGPRNRNIFTLA